MAAASQRARGSGFIGLIGLIDLIGLIGFIGVYRVEGEFKV